VNIFYEELLKEIVQARKNRLDVSKKLVDLDNNLGTSNVLEQRVFHKSPIEF